MSSSAELQLVYKVANTPFNAFPYPHFFLEDVFPADFYRQLQANLPDPRSMRSLLEARNVKGYDERFVLGFADAELAVLPEGQQAFWKGLREWLSGDKFMKLMLGKFAPYVAQRFKGLPEADYYNEMLLVQDTTNYALGPHSDAPRKVVTLLFYLPADDTQRHLGTSIYVPKDPRFRCPGGPHYPREAFDLMCTMPYLPNSLFAFFKTDNSFHGVERVGDADCRRWLLLYDIYRKRKPADAAPQ